MMRERFEDAEREFFAHKKGKPWRPALMDRYKRLIGAAIAWGCEIGASAQHDAITEAALRGSAALLQVGRKL